MSFSSALRDFLPTFATISDRHDVRDHLGIVPFDETTRPDPETVHRVRWELDRLARKNERETRQRRLREATPNPEFPKPRDGQEVA